MDKNEKLEEVETGVRQPLSTVSSYFSSLNELLCMQKYLMTTFPGAKLMPTGSSGKSPMHEHKNGTYSAEYFLRQGFRECRHGCLIILTEDIIVVDVDKPHYCKKFEDAFPDSRNTVACKTRKGMHYYFTSTQTSKQANVRDGARQMIDWETNEDIPIDIKTKNPNVTGGVISIPPSPNKQWVRKLGKAAVLPLPDSFVEFYVAHLKNAPSHEKKKKKKPNPAKKADPETVSEAERLLGMLNPSRADDYDSWMRVGWCLHNICVDMLDAWVEFSKQSKKYVRGECRYLWNDMRDEGLGLGSLHMWARQDNPEAYMLFMNERVFADIRDCNGSHHSIAMIAHKLYSKTFVCASTNGKLWYKFNGTLWEEDTEAIQLRLELSKGLRHQFMRVLGAVRMQDVENQSSASSTHNPNREVCERLLSISFKLECSGFKESLIKELRDVFYDKSFMSSLDTDPNLIAFTNGVWDLKAGRFRQATADDHLSLSVGFAYDETEDRHVQSQIRMYLERLHPNAEQREYLVKMLARQLYGDSGNELFHVHAGAWQSAGNGKSKFFEILQMALGDYIHKFPVEVLVVKQRSEPHKPVPEYNNWRGRRLLFCSEPNPDDKLHSGIMKELTGGESFCYRLLFSNDMQKFRPMYKMHIMCNKAPVLDGSDSGVKRRIRKLDYVARFVDAEEVNESAFMFLKDLTFIERCRDDPCYRMEFLRYILQHYDHGFGYEMPDVVRSNSAAYLDDNNEILQFVKEWIVADKEGFFTLKDAKEVLKGTDYCKGYKIASLKRDLEGILKTGCLEQKKVEQKNITNVFCGFKLKNLLDFGG